LLRAFTPGRVKRAPVAAPLKGRTMKRALLLVAVVLLAREAQAETLFHRSYNTLFYPTAITPGQQLTFKITRDALPDFTFNYTIPDLPLSCCKASYPITITEATADSFGLDWAALGEALVGDDGQATMFGVSPSFDTTPYLFHPTGFYGSVNLTDVTMSTTIAGLTGSLYWINASITLHADSFAYLAPEPSAFVLCLLGCAHGVRLKRFSTRNRS
jgi:hypothetical protein